MNKELKDKTMSYTDLLLWLNSNKEDTPYPYVKDFIINNCVFFDFPKNITVFYKHRIKRIPFLPYWNWNTVNINFFLGYFVDGAYVINNTFKTIEDEKST